MKILLCIFGCIAAAAAHGFGHSSFYLQSHPVHHINKFAHFPPTTVVGPSFAPVVRSHVGFGYPYFKSIGFNYPNTVNLPSYPIAFKPTIYTAPAGIPFGHVPFIIQFVPIDGKNGTNSTEKPDKEETTPEPEKEEESEDVNPTESTEDREETTDRAARSPKPEPAAESATPKDAANLADLSPDDPRR